MLCFVSPAACAGLVKTSHNLRQDIILGGLLSRGGDQGGLSHGPRAIISAKPMHMLMGAAAAAGPAAGSTTTTDSAAGQPNNAAPATLYKLLLGGVPMATYSGPRFPNQTSSAFNYRNIVQNCSQGCLYEVLADPTEHHEISAAHPQIVAELRTRLEAAEALAWIPERGTPMKEACDRTRYSGHYGPWLELGEIDVNAA